MLKSTVRVLENGSYQIFANKNCLFWAFVCAENKN